jgi:mono/diheme cytochrome c family protein
MTAPTAAEEARSFPNDQITAGAELYTVNCSPCHGARMEDQDQLQALWAYVVAGER